MALEGITNFDNYDLVKAREFALDKAADLLSFSGITLKRDAETLVQEAAVIEKYILSDLAPEPIAEDVDYPVLGPEMFTNREHSVICWKGENYYRACGNQVTLNDDGSGSTCVKRVDHPGLDHEDYDGQIHNDFYGATTDYLRVFSPKVLVDERVVSREDIQKAWDMFITPGQKSGIDQTEEWHTIMAVLRAVNMALPYDTLTEVVTDVSEDSEAPSGD